MDRVESVVIPDTMDQPTRPAERPAGYQPAEPRRGNANPGKPGMTTTNLWIDKETQALSTRTPLGRRPPPAEAKLCALEAKLRRIAGVLPQSPEFCLKVFFFYHPMYTYSLSQLSTIHRVYVYLRRDTLFFWTAVWSTPFPPLSSLSPVRCGSEELRRRDHTRPALD